MRKICQRCVSQNSCTFLKYKAPEACPSVRAYDLGTNDQRKIDIDKAIKWLNEHTNWDDIYGTSEDGKCEVEELFRKAMQ